MMSLSVASLFLLALFPCISAWHPASPSFRYVPSYYYNARHYHDHLFDPSFFIINDYAYVMSQFDGYYTSSIHDYEYHHEMQQWRKDVQQAYARHQVTFARNAAFLEMEKMRNTPSSYFIHIDYAAVIGTLASYQRELKSYKIQYPLDWVHLVLRGTPAIFFSYLEGDEWMKEMKERYDDYQVDTARSVAEQMHTKLQQGTETFFKHTSLDVALGVFQKYKTVAQRCSRHAQAGEATKWIQKVRNEHAVYECVVARNPAASLWNAYVLHGADGFFQGRNTPAALDMLRHFKTVATQNACHVDASDASMWLTDMEAASVDYACRVARVAAYGYYTLFLKSVNETFGRDHDRFIVMPVMDMYVTRAKAFHSFSGIDDVQVTQALQWQHDINVAFSTAECNGLRTQGHDLQMQLQEMGTSFYEKHTFSKVVNVVNQFREKAVFLHQAEDVTQALVWLERLTLVWNQYQCEKSQLRASSARYVILNATLEAYSSPPSFSTELLALQTFVKAATVHHAPEPLAEATAWKKECTAHIVTFTLAILQRNAESTLKAVRIVKPADFNSIDELNAQREQSTESVQWYMNVAPSKDTAQGQSWLKEVNTRFDDVMTAYLHEHVDDLQLNVGRSEVGSLTLWNDAHIDELVQANVNGRPHFKTEKVKSQMQAISDKASMWGDHLLALKRLCTSGDILLMDAFTSTACTEVEVSEKNFATFQNKMKNAESILQLSGLKLAGKFLWHLFTLQWQKLSLG